jgi:ribosomal protein L29
MSKHTIEELKQMLIDKTAEYVKLESQNKCEASDIRHIIGTLKNTIASVEGGEMHTYKRILKDCEGVAHNLMLLSEKQRKILANTTNILNDEKELFKELVKSSIENRKLFTLGIKAAEQILTGWVDSINKGK